MTLDCNKYRINKAYLKQMLDDKSPEERLEMIGGLSLITYVPIIVVSCYIGELYGFTDPLNLFIDRMKEFYGITEILNIELA